MRRTSGEKRRGKPSLMVVTQDMDITDGRRAPTAPRSPAAWGTAMFIKGTELLSEILADMIVCLEIGNAAYGLPTCFLFFFLRYLSCGY